MHIVSSRLRAITIAAVALALSLAGCGNPSNPPTDLGNDLPTPEVSVSISPISATLNPGQTQTFLATVMNASDPGVTWSVSEGVAGGTITAGGIYTAASPGTYHVLATSIADPSKSASATVTVVTEPQVGITLSPTSASVSIGGTQSFTATVTNASDTTVTWKVMESNGGSVSTTGVYMAPGSAGVYHVIATSNADATKSATATVTVKPTVTIKPASATLNGGAMQPFFAVVAGVANTAVSWSVKEGSIGGIVDGGGTYTAPSTLGTYHVLAISVADPTVQASATVDVTNVPQVSITIAPGTVALDEGAGQTFTATVTNPGSGGTGATWQVVETGGGSIDAMGHYTAPFVAGTYHVVGASAADPSKTAVAVVTVRQASVTLDVTSITVPEGGTNLLHATVANSVNPSVNWTLTEGASGGTLSGTGLYTAPLHAGTYHVVATSAADGTASATATVTVPAIGVAVSPSPVTLDQGAPQVFSATVSGAANGNVTWTASAGSINPTNGTFTAPSSAGTVTVTATSAADGTTTGSAMVTVRPVAIALTEGMVTLDQGATHTFVATVTGSVNAAVTWSISPSSNCGSMMGSTYTAPLHQATCTVTATSSADPTKTASATVHVNAVTVMVSPTPVTLDQGAAQSFAAVVTGATNKSVTWSASCGGVDGSGNYVAPANQAAAQTCTVTATSASDGTTGSATVHVNALSLAFTESNVALDQGASHTFAVNVSGIANKTVTFAWTCTGGASGSKAVLTAPFYNNGAGGTCTITATAADGGTAQLVATINAVKATLSPTSVKLAPGQSASFVATVTGTVNPIAWSATGGTINQSGLYFAPSGTGTFTVTAQTSDASVAPTATVFVTNVVSVSISPKSVTLGNGQSQSFLAMVSGSTNQNVTWSLGGGSVGTLSPLGVYTASATGGGTATVIATSVADGTKSDSATVTLSTTPQVAVSVSPPAISLGTGQSKQFSATVQNGATGNVTWSIAEGAVGGSISPAGLYRSPGAAGTFHVVATSVDDPTKAGSATVTVTTGPPIAVSVTPGSVTLGSGMTQQFTATVNGTSNQGVTWSLGAGSSGAIDGNGLYTAGSGSATVIATSVLDTTRSGQASVTFQSTVTVSITPSQISVSVNGTQQFTAQVIGSSNQSVSFSVAGGACGVVDSATGLYTAPAAPATGCTVIATAMAAPAAAKAIVTIVTSSLFTVSGTIAYGAGSATKHNNIFLSLVDNGGAVAAGTHIGAAGPFTIRGVFGGRSYTLYAWDDAGGMIQISRAVDWFSQTAVPSSGQLMGNLSGVSVTLSPPSPVAPTASPQMEFVLAGDSEAGVGFKHLTSSNLDICDHYTIYVSTTQPPGPTNNIMVRTVPWWNGHFSLLAPLSPGTYFVSMSGGNSAGEGPLPAQGTSFTVGPASGGNTVTGSVNIPSSITPSGTLYVFLGQGSGNGPPKAVFGTRVPNPVVGNNPFTITGVPSGTYDTYLTLDQLDDGILGPLDPSAQTRGQVIPASTPLSLGFSTANATLDVYTDHQCDGSQGGNCTGSGANQNDSFALEVGATTQRKLVYAATLLSGNNLGTAIPIDLGYDIFNDQTNIGIRWYRPAPGYVPVVGDSLNASVVFQDGTSQSVSGTIQAIAPYPILAAPTGSPPTFSWTVGAGMTAHNLEVYLQNMGFQQFWNLNSPLSPVQYAGTPLTSGTTYLWQVYARDSLGNSGSTTGSFVAP